MTSEEKNTIEGVWELVSTKPLLPDGSFESCLDEWNMMKIVTKSHFMFVEQAPDISQYLSFLIFILWRFYAQFLLFYYKNIPRHFSHQKTSNL